MGPRHWFGNREGVTTNISGDSAADMGVVQPDGDVVVARTAGNRGSSRVVLVRDQDKSPSRPRPGRRGIRRGWSPRLRIRECSVALGLSAARIDPVSPDDAVHRSRLVAIVASTHVKSGCTGSDHGKQNVRSDNEARRRWRVWLGCTQSERGQPAGPWWPGHRRGAVVRKIRCHRLYFRSPPALSYIL
jgi:hypothetical protein